MAKSFTLHLRGGAVLPVIAGATLAVHPGECVVLGGASGAGKSSLLKMAYGNYRCAAGAIRVRDGDRHRRPRHGRAARDPGPAPHHPVLRLAVPAGDPPRRRPRRGGGRRHRGRPRRRRRPATRAGDLLARLNLPERLWALPPATFSGGEQQRVNIARGLIADRPILLMDEPTASLDARNRAVVVDLIAEKRAAGTAILGIFHDADVREAVATRIVDVSAFRGALAA